MRRVFTLLFLGSLLAACEGTEPSTDGGPTTCESPPTLDDVTSEGHPEPLAAGPGEVRAGRLAAEDLPPDPDSMLPWAAGDYVLANDRVAFVVEGVDGVSHGFDPHGGQPVGIARVEDGALLEPTNFSELFFTFDRSAVAPRRVGVLRDGSDGGPAIVRAVGPVEVIGAFDFFEGVIRGAPTGFEVALDYVLAPDADSVEVRASIANPSAAGVAIRTPLLFAAQQNRTPKYVPGRGFDGDVSAAPYYAFADALATSFAFESEGGDLRGLLEQSNLLLIQLPRYTADGCATTEHVLGRFHIGGPGIDALLANVAEAHGETLVEIAGTIVSSDGSPVEGGRVHASATDGTYLTRATTDAEGRYALHVPPGDVVLRAWRQGDAPSAEVTVEAPSTATDLTLGPTGVVDVHVTDALGAPIPATVEAVPNEGEPFVAPAEWGEGRVVRGRENVVYSTDGNASLRLPEGSYTIVVSRGFEWEAATLLDVEVTDGAALSLDATLEHVIDTPGVMCGDFHIHTHRSFDAEDELRLKVRAAVASGLEIPVRSEHEWVSDFEPTLAELGLEEHAYGIGSLELTTLVYGHFGVFPLDPDPAARNGGAVEWVRRDPPEVLADARGRTGMHGSAEVIINHPRISGALLGYFNAVGLDPLTGMVGNPDLYYEDFRLIEVFNDSDFDANESTVVRDWFTLLGQGRRVFAVGSSDSHEVFRQPIGYPRTCVDVGVDTAPELRDLGAGHVRDRMLDGASVVTGGVFVEPLARGDLGPGSTVTGAMARETIDVRVRAASWVGVDRLRVYVDGELRETIPIDASTEDPLDPTIRLQAPVEVETGGWVVFVADGEGDLGPVYPGRRAFGVSNPIFFE